MCELQTYKNGIQVDEAVVKIIEFYWRSEYKHWLESDKPEEHIIHQLNILKTLYDLGSPEDIL